MALPYSTFTVVYDACVLYPASLRDLLIRLGQTGVFRARWTQRIVEEALRSLARDRPDLDSARLQRTGELINTSIRDCLVTGYDQLTASLQLPDEDDRHVLAAAVRCGAQVIVTNNLRDFPSEALAPLGVEAQTPDEFVQHVVELAPETVAQVLVEQATALRRPPMTVWNLIDRLAHSGLVEAMRSIRPWVAELAPEPPAERHSPASEPGAGESVPSTPRSLGLRSALLLGQHLPNRCPQLFTQLGVLQQPPHGRRVLVRPPGQGRNHGVHEPPLNPVAPGDAFVLLGAPRLH